MGQGWIVRLAAPGMVVCAALAGAGAAHGSVAASVPSLGSPTASLLATQLGSAPTYEPATSQVCDPTSDAGQVVRTLLGGVQQTICYDESGNIADIVPSPEGFKTLDARADPIDFGDPGSGPCTRTDYCGQGDFPDDVDPSAPIAATSTSGPELSLPAAGATTPPKTSVFWGLSDNNLIIPALCGSCANPPFDIFTNQYFPPLAVANVRLIVPWDVETHLATYEQLNTDAWIASAALAGKHVFISFEKCHDPNTLHETPQCNALTALPSASAYAAATRLFVLAHPTVHDYTAWNEPNNAGQPTRKNPARAANFYVKLAQTCAGRCRVAAGDFIDGPSKRLTSYVTRYVKTLGHMRVGRFSWHPYSDAQRSPNFPRLRSYVQFVHRYDPSANIWVTEVGAFHDFPAGGIHNSDAAQGQITQKIVTGIPAVDRKIDRLFYYSLKGAPVFDTGLLALDGTPRTNSAGTYAYDRYENR